MHRVFVLSDSKTNSSTILHYCKGLNNPFNAIPDFVIVHRAAS